MLYKKINLVQYIWSVFIYAVAEIQEHVCRGSIPRITNKDIIQSRKIHFLEGEGFQIKDMTTVGRDSRTWSVQERCISVSSFDKPSYAIVFTCFIENAPKA